MYTFFQSSKRLIYKQMFSISYLLFSYLLFYLIRDKRTKKETDIILHIYSVGKQLAIIGEVH